MSNESTDLPAPDLFSFLEVFSPGKKLLNKNVDSKGWNDTWNRYLEWMYSPTRVSESRPLNNWTLYWNALENPLNNRTAIAQIRDSHNGLKKLQDNLRATLGDQREIYALWWLSVDSSVRLTHIRNALVRMCSFWYNELGRRECPESTDAFLERDSGRGFLDLITTFCPPQSGTASQISQAEPILLSHPQHAIINGLNQSCPPGRDPAIWDLIRSTANCARSNFLCSLILGVIYDSQGIDLPESRTKKPSRGVKREIKDFMAQFSPSKNATPGSEDWAMSQAKKASSRIWKDFPRVCTACCRSQDALPPGVTFAFCVRCLQMNHKVPYCNRECQNRDWKLGNPPHKKICGKPISIPAPSPTVSLHSFDQALGTSTREPWEIPPPDLGYVRSPALVGQIVTLEYYRQSTGSSVAYVFKFGDKAQGQFGFADQSIWEASFFKTFRNHACRDGSPNAVAVMYKFFSQSIKPDAVPIHLILIQLSREFDIEPQRLTELAQDIPVRELSKANRETFLAEMESVLTLD